MATAITRKALRLTSHLFHFPGSLKQEVGRYLRLLRRTQLGHLQDLLNILFFLEFNRFGRVLCFEGGAASPSIYSPSKGVRTSREDLRLETFSEVRLILGILGNEYHSKHWSSLCIFHVGQHFINMNLVDSTLLAI